MTTATGAGIATGQIETWAGPIRVQASERGLQSVQLPRWAGASPDAARQPASAADALILTPGSAQATRYVRQGLGELAEYFAGSRTVFTVPLDLSGPPFFIHVWEAVHKVPYGETRSYQEIAQILGAPAATRAVGAANGANPVAPIVPCHRIVGSGGDLTGYGPGLPLKQRLLAMEDAVPSSGSDVDYVAWVERVGARLGTKDWVLGLRRGRAYCLPKQAPLSRRESPNRCFRSEREAQSAGYRPLVSHTRARG